MFREVTGSLIDFSDTGVAEWKAANGDSIFTTVLGQAEFSDLPGGFLHVTEVHVITGGTGRFAGVHGSFCVELFHELAANDISDGVESHAIFGSFHGTMTSPGAAQKK